MPFEDVRDFGDRPDVGGDVLAFRAVAAGRSLHEPAVLVADRDRQSVDLRLGGDLERIVFAEIQEAAHAGDEIDDVLVRERVAE